MTAATEPAPRIASLDIVRGVAVMGILAMNIVAFAMPFQAYMDPTAYGLEGAADFWSWVFSFVFVDGRMRGLFSFLFGASTLLVIERAEAAGVSPAAAHYRRMLWLLLFGLAHFYFIWFGDILAGYALVGLVLYLFRDQSVRGLVALGLGLVAIQTLVFLLLAGSISMLAQAAAAPVPDPEMVRQWQALERDFGGSAPAISQNLALHQGSWSGLVANRIGERGIEPFTGVLMFGWETLGYMLLGMAALKSGFFKGEWSLAAYRRVALGGLAFGVPAYALLAWLAVRSGFDIPSIFLIEMAATTPFRPVMVVAYAALIILLSRRGGALVERIAAAGRAAFTNYLGTSLIMTTIFYGYGFGLYGTMSRIQLWIPVVALWALMLLWSKPWLDRFRYGPFEWLWRSLARWRLEPMR
ncbi:DUF418 domain-containing protein [Sphingosinicella terrae]|uniref:DUF418 domain-containing protein n=1 Tax=Sphingosinicella terrae TaxID=2172047 RepID=UPI000E0DF7B0|nr:DUF418 domain-containing protein [Sphingosinicella terrae]